jgi:hypothetical protein
MCCIRSLVKPHDIIGNYDNRTSQEQHYAQSIEDRQFDD